MAYKLFITDIAEEIFDHLVSHILFKFKNEPAAKHLLDGIELIYDRLQDNPYQFSDCRDPFLKSKEYKEAVVKAMDYIFNLSYRRGCRICTWNLSSIRIEWPMSLMYFMNKKHVSKSGVARSS